MFRLYFLGTDGKTNGAVPADLSDFGGADFQCSHAMTARAFAAEASQRSESNVLVAFVVKRIRGRRIWEDVRPAYIITPDGRRLSPPGAVVIERERCTRGGDRPCFCSACRAERRARR